MRHTDSAGRRHHRPMGRRAHSPRSIDARWVVALPAWGDRCVYLLIQYTLPAVLKAAKALSRPITLLIWTDQEVRVHRVLDVLCPGVDNGVFSVPGPDQSFMSMSACHHQALQAAAPHDRVLLLTADMVVSREVLATCEAQIMAGKSLVCCVPPRALQDAGPPVGATGRELMEWAWANRHRMTRECTWPEGRSYDIWRMYFEEGGEVAARVFLPHPLAVVHGGRRLAFHPTIDVNLTANFSQAQTHLITSPDEGAVVEVSPTDKDFLLTTTMRERMTDTQNSCPPLIRATNRRHCMFFGKRVVIRGAGGDCGDREVVERVLG